MKKVILFCTALFFLIELSAQQKMWVFFIDKGPQVQDILSQPGSFLSDNALETKQARNISISSTDVPVHPAYVNTIKGLGIDVLGSSRWLNAAVVSADENELDRIAALDCVHSIQAMRTMVSSREKEFSIASFEDLQHISAPFDYGKASVQTDMLNLQALHSKGLTGKGVRIAIFDAGFTNAHKIGAFDSLWQQNRIIAFHDFVTGNDSSAFGYASHGTEVLSCIGANAPGEMVGTAPHATFMLARTEDGRSETRQEEYNWVKAMEWADSIGVDIIHSSLGYNTFDDAAESYSYEQMDGNTAIITRAADIAASRGIIVTTSAGNAGGSPWRYLTAPCDADSVLCVGAITKYHKRAGFSSFGPASDGRTKPDVVALGAAATVVGTNGKTTYANGTSFAAPIIAGFTACLRQAHPNRSNMDIIQAIRLSADQYALPDDEYGYGIPNAGKADSLLSNVQDLSSVTIKMSEKPKRGIKPKYKKKKKKVEITFTSNPQTRVLVNSDNLLVQTTKDGVMLQDFHLVRGKQKLTIDPAEINLSDQKAVISTKYLLKGKYYVMVRTNKYTEYVKFEIF